MYVSKTRLSLKIENRLLKTLNCGLERVLSTNEGFPGGHLGWTGLGDGLW